MENITKERLMQAGWYLGRIIDISEFENKYKEIGMEMPGIVKDFLRTSGKSVILIILIVILLLIIFSQIKKQPIVEC